MAALDKIFELLDEEPDARRRAGRRRARARLRGEIELRRRVVPLRRGRRRRLRAGRRLADRPAGPDRRARGRDRRGQVDARQARRALLRPDRRARSSSTATTCATSRRVAALADGHRPAGGLPVQRDDRREHRLRAARRDATTRSRAAARAVGADGRSSRPRDGSTRRSASAASSSRPASASSSPSPARSSPTRGSWSSTRRRRTSTCTPRAGSRRACAACSPGRTAIVIAHRLSTIRQAGRIVVLDARADRRAGHARRAGRRRGRLLAPLPRLGGAGRRVGARTAGQGLEP